MPVVYRIAAIDDFGECRLEAWSLDPQIEPTTQARFERTLTRFFRDAPIEHISLKVLLACRGCGCTEDHACAGGCHWTPGEEDLCSRCAGIVR
jgi:hypothetical protein